MADTDTSPTGPYPGGPFAAVADALSGRTIDQGVELRGRLDEVARRQHELAVAALVDQVNEVTAQATHRAQLRRLAERETRARAIQQELCAVGIGVCVALAVVIMLAVGVFVVTS